MITYHRIFPIITKKTVIILTALLLAASSMGNAVLAAAQYYTVEYVEGANGYIAGNASEQVASGDRPVNIPIVIANSGYIFTGWSSEENGGALLTRTQLSGIIITGNKKFYAQYEKDTVKVTYNAGDHGAILGASSEAVPFEEYPVSVPEVAAYNGYSFKGWSSNRGSTLLTTEQVKQVRVTGPVTYTAYYEENLYTLTYLPGDHGMITSSSTETRKFGEYPQSVPQPVADEGYTFIGWSRDNDATIKTDYELRITPVTATVTYTAYYEVSNYYITYTAGKHGRLQGESMERVLHGGYPQKVPVAIPDDGYIFYGWSADGGITLLTSDVLKTTAAAKSTAYLAIFTESANGLSVLSTPAGTGTMDGKTILTVSPAPIGGNSLVFRNFGQAEPEIPYIGDTLADYAYLPGNRIITAGQGDKIAVAEVDPWGRVARFGQALVYAVPAAPQLQSEDQLSQVVLRWSPSSGSSAYKLYQKTGDNADYAPLATVQASVYEYTVTDLTYGTVYSFAVKAGNTSGDSSFSQAVQFKPRTLPLPPANVSAEAGHLEAKVSFTPVNNGGGNQVVYEVVANPGNITASGSSSPITVTGLTNGTEYTFSVRTVNEVGSSQLSAPSNSVIPRPLSAPSPMFFAGIPAEQKKIFSVSGQEVILHTEDWGKAETVQEGQQRNINYVLNSEKLLDALQSAELPADKAVFLPVSLDDKADGYSIQIDAQGAQYLKEHHITVRIHTAKAAIQLPFQELDVDGLVHKVGAASQEVRIEINLADAPPEIIRHMQQSSLQQGFALVVLPVQFSVRAVANAQTLELERFDSYLERSIPLPEWASGDGVTSVVRIDPDLSMHHVPTLLEKEDKLTTAVTHSMSNGIFATIRSIGWFWDTQEHWAREAIADLAARRIVNGSANYLFYPDQAVSRGEFASILIRALGLEEIDTADATFTDVKPEDWFKSSVETAYAYKLVSGFEDGTFRANTAITREEAMQMLARSVNIVGKQRLSASSPGLVLSDFQDADSLAEWAKEAVELCLQNGIVTGKEEGQLAPKSFISRAEIAVMVQRLLQKVSFIS